MNACCIFSAEKRKSKIDEEEKIGGERESGRQIELIESGNLAQVILGMSS